MANMVNDAGSHMSADPGPPYFCLSGHEHPTIIETLKCDRAWDHYEDDDEGDRPHDTARWDSSGFGG